MDNEDRYGPYGALVEKEAVCAGIAEALKIMCERIGIPCITIHSDSHAWNVVDLNGRLYHLNATCDLGESPNSWGYYLLSDSESRDLKDGSHEYYESMRYHYFQHYGAYFESLR